MNKGITPEINELLAFRHFAASIQFFNRQKVQAVQTGSKLSQARGRGMDFEEVRRYQPGDDIRLIHWSLTARLDKPFTKIYREERERAVYLIVDQSTSMQFGTRVCFKSVLAAKIAAILGWAALSHHEQIGGIIFNEQTANFIKPKRSRQSLLDIFNLLQNNAGIKQQAGGLSNALRFLSQKCQSGSVVILISDYRQFDAASSASLRIIGQKCEVINFFIYDPIEEKLPQSGLYAFTAAGKGILEINASQKNQSIYQNSFEQRRQDLANLLQKNRMQFVPIATNDNLVQKINQGIMKYGY